MQQKHILFLSSWFPTQENPYTGDFVARLALQISTFHRVTVIFTHSKEEIEDLEFNFHHEGNYSSYIIYHPKGKNILEKYRWQKKALFFGFSKIDRIDLIHANVSLPRAHQFIQAKKYFKVPLILTEHSAILCQNYFQELSILEKYQFKRLMKFCDQIVYVSDFLKHEIQHQVKGIKTSVIPNGINLSQFIPKVKQHALTQFLHISNLDPRFKNVYGIIDAVEHLIAMDYTDFHLTIASDENMRELKLYASEKQLRNFISFVGPIPYEEVHTLYADADCFILNSNLETFSIVLAEAWASGLPTLTTPVGIGANLSPDLGFQTKMNDAEDVAKKMAKFMEEPQIFDAEKIRQHALVYDQDTVIRQYLDLYQLVLHG